MNISSVQANKNLADLAENKCPGCVIVIGKDKKDENLIQLYCVTGQNEKSRNIRFENYKSPFKVQVEIADIRKLDEGEDTSLIVYTAMDHSFGFHVVGNGVQTDEIINNCLTMTVAEEEAFSKAIFKYKYGADDPNFTPRISATSYVNPKLQPIIRHTELSIVKKFDFSDDAEYSFFPLKELVPGFGFCIHTYDGDGKPLPAFSKKPYPLPLFGDDIETISKDFWDMFNPYKRASLATKSINLKTGQSEICIINAY